MSLRPSPWVFGVGSSRRAQQSALRQPVQQPRPELRVLEGGGQTARKVRLSQARIIASVVLVALLLFAVVTFHVVLSQGQFALEKVENRADDEQAQFERLRLEVAQLESPKRITEEATNRLGMVPAESVTAITPRPEDISPALGDGRHFSAESDCAEAWGDIKPHLSSSAK